MPKPTIEEALAIISVKLDYMIHITERTVVTQNVVTGKSEKSTISGEERFARWVAERQLEKAKPVPVENEKKSNPKLNEKLSKIDKKLHKPEKVEDSPKKEDGGAGTKEKGKA